MSTTLNPNFPKSYTGLLRAGNILVVTGPTDTGSTTVNLLRSGVVFSLDIVPSGGSSSYGPYNLDVNYMAHSSGHGSTVSHQESATGSPVAGPLTPATGDIGQVLPQ
jgi:hypothetical protein